MSHTTHNTSVISESVQNYLKAIYELEETGQGANTQDIANRVRVSSPGVTKMLRHLADKHLVEYTPYQPVHLSALGKKIALEVIRHHRLLELYLQETLGFGWEQVHAEADRLEHHISEEFEDSIDRLLGFPQFDPHGDPIPTRDGLIPAVATETLDQQQLGTRLIIRRVADEDAELLRYLGEKNIRPGAKVVVTNREPFGGSLNVRIADQNERITPNAARNVFVELLTLADESFETSDLHE